jgi:hypothetical protein
MTSLNKMILTIALVAIFATTMNGQSRDNNLNKIWELISVEQLAGMGSYGEEFKTLDMRDETQLLFEGGGHSGALTYKVIDQEITLLDKEGNPVGQDIIWMIERLTVDELDFVFIARDDKKTKLVRMKYRAKG